MSHRKYAVCRKCDGWDLMRSVYVPDANAAILITFITTLFDIEITAGTYLSFMYQHFRAITTFQTESTILTNFKT